MAEGLFANPTGLLAGILIAATLGAVPVSYIILHRYSAAVARTMRKGDDPDDYVSFYDQMIDED